MEHGFTPAIRAILEKHFKKNGGVIFENSSLIQYINIKTVSATRGSKSRSSFASLYALYVLVEDYIQKGFIKGGYSEYDGAKYKNLFDRQRELPFGNKLQNHALNHRMNQEFRKFFPHIDSIPILRVVDTKRYWINEKLLYVTCGKRRFNIASCIIEIINQYIETKKTSFENFIITCEKLRNIAKKKEDEVKNFIHDLLAPNVDARIFEITSYAILKFFYRDQTVYFGFDLDDLVETPLSLFKTGRTNANDGGIDFVMKPLGRFFQVTETLDTKKYFLDIDKVERYPISFVIKSDEVISQLKAKLKEGAEKQYSIKAIVKKYMTCIEEIINLTVLHERLDTAIQNGYLNDILKEIILQSKVEFNF